MLRQRLTTTFVWTIFVLGGAWSGSAQAAALQGNPGQCSVESGQLLITQGRYSQAIREFTCVISSNPTEVEGYRGRSEAELLLGRYSDAMHTYTQVTAFVLPVHPDAKSTILAGYASRLAGSPDDITALIGASFARWYFFDYAQAIPLLNHLLDVDPLNLFGNLFRGSTRLLHNATLRGVTDLEMAIALAPQSADVRWIVADAYTYGLPDPSRAFLEATQALNWGLNTPRIHAILGAAYLAFGEDDAAAVEIRTHIDMVTTALLPASPLLAGTSMNLPVTPGQTYEIPLPVVAGETVSLASSSHDYFDTILVLLAPDGSTVLGADDTKGYFAGFNWAAGASGTYRVRITFFEGVITGNIFVQRK